MSFNFFGTFTTAQFQDLVDFAKIQEKDVSERIRWLSSELLKVGVFNTVYDEEGRVPVVFTCSPPSSYGAKLLQAYKILGGVPEHDMLLRTSDQPVFLKKGTNVDPGNPDSGYSREFSNGRLLRGTQRFDRDVGLKVERLKKWQIESVKHKREHLEFKIKRALDYSDQLQIESNLLTLMSKGASGSSVEDMIAEVNKLILRPGAMNVVEDMEDRWGLRIGPVGDKYVDTPGDADSKALRGMT